MPPATTRGNWTHTIVYNFQGGASDASNPHGDLHADGAGGFYGLAGAGTGPTGNGGLYKVTAPATADGVWTEQLLASFGGATGDGTAPDSFTMDGSGNFYVSLLLNGSSKRGQIVELTPGSSGYSLTVLHNFKAGHGSTDGTYPYRLAIANGVVYGVTGLGGTPISARSIR